MIELVDQYRSTPHALAEGMMDLFGGRDTIESEAAAFFFAEGYCAWRKANAVKA